MEQLARIAPASTPLPPSRERVVGTRAAQVRLTGHWSEILSDLACLGPLWAETATHAVGLGHRIEPAALRERDGVGVLSSRDHALRLMLDRCHALHVRRDDHLAVHIEDASGVSLLMLRPDKDAAAFPLRLLLAANGGVGRRIVPVPAGASGAGGLVDARDHGVVLLQRRSNGIDDGMALIDVAEVTGLLALDPARLRSRGSAVAVEPDLVPCGLEALADQMVTLWLVTGGDGVARRVDLTPFGHRQVDAWQHLYGDGMRLRINTRALDSAWVCRPAGEGPRELRLYDAQGRGIAVVGCRPGRPGTEHPVWRAVMNALVG